VIPSPDFADCPESAATQTDFDRVCCHRVAACEASQGDTDGKNKSLAAREVYCQKLHFDSNSEDSYAA